MTAPEYRISTIGDFLKVPVEKQAELLRDFGHWLELAREHATLDDLVRTIAGDGVTFDTSAFTWIDDGVAGLSAFDFKTTEGEQVVRLNVVQVEHVQEREVVETGEAA